MALTEGLEAEIDTLLLGCRILAHQRVFDSSGHLTLRLPGTTHFLIAARAAPGLATRESLMVIDEDGTVLEGSGTIPLEWAIHGRIYRRRPDVTSIVHSHSPMSRAFGMSTVPLQPVYGIAAPWLHRDVPVYTAPGMIGGSDAGDAVADVLGDGPAVLLRAHGSVVVGPSIEATVVRATTLEQVALSLQQALAMGPIVAPDPHEIEHWRSTTPAGHGKAWDYLVSEYLTQGAGHETRPI